MGVGTGGATGDRVTHILMKPRVKGTQSRNPYTSLSGKSAMNLIKCLLLLRPDPARLPPLPGTQPLVIQTSQYLVLSVYYTALFSLQAVSTGHAQ